MQSTFLPVSQNSIISAQRLCSFEIHDKCIGCLQYDEGGGFAPSRQTTLQPVYGTGDVEEEMFTQ